MREFNDLWAKGLQHTSDLLIKRGTAMGPLIPLLFLVPAFLVAAYIFKGTLWLSSLLIFVAIGIVVVYIYQYSKYATNDPDRLQSEEYRYEMKKIQMIASKELPNPVPASDLNLSDPTSNPVHPFPNIEGIVSNQDSSSNGGES